jgi:MerR family transcriptional regulator, light-induced transcriptional regulator
MKTHGYPIRAAAKLAGLSTDTLRAWERRYRAVVPARGARGRVYSPEQVARLRWLRDAVSAGHSIGQVAPLSDREIRALLNDSRGSKTSKRRESGAHELHERTLTYVMAALERYDFAEAEAELSRLATLLMPRQLVLDVLMPLLRRVGAAWHSGRLHIAHEHMVSAILRSLLGALTRLYQVRSPAKKLLITTPTGEMHEFGILTAALLAVGQGIGVVYLGTDLPAKEILRAAKMTNVDLVLLGITRTRGNAMSMREARRVADGLPKGKTLWVGGKAHRTFRKGVKAGRVVLLENFEMLESALGDLAA